MSNYILENEQQVLEIYRDWDRRKRNAGRVEGDRRRAETDLAVAKDNFFWSLIMLAVAAAAVFTNAGI